MSLGIKEFSSSSLDNSTIVYKLSAENTFDALMAIQLLFSATHLVLQHLCERNLIILRNAISGYVREKKQTTIVKPLLGENCWCTNKKASQFSATLSLSRCPVLVF